MIINTETSIQELLQQKYVSRRTFNICQKLNLLTAGDIAKCSLYTLSHVEGCGSKSMKEFRDVKDSLVPNLFTLADDPADMLRDQIQVNNRPEPPRSSLLIEKRNIFEGFPDELRFEFQNRVAELKTNLSRRTLNLFSNLLEFPEIFRLLYELSKEALMRTPRAGIKCVDEILNFSNNVREIFEGMEKNLAQFSSEADLEAFINSKKFDTIKAKYPFLTNDEVWFLTKSQDISLKRKILFFLHSYILHSESRDASLLRDYYNFENLPLPVDCCSKYNLSRERIRQILIKALSLPDALKEEANAILIPEEINVIPFDEPHLAAAHMLHPIAISPRQFLALICCINPWFSIIEFDDSDEIFLVRTALFSNVRFRTTIAKIKRQTFSCGDKTEEIDLINCLTGGEDLSKFNPNISELCKVMVSYFRRIPGFRIIDDTHLQVYDPRFNKMRGIEEILRIEGKPMHLADLWEAYCKRYPKNPLKDQSSLRSYIQRNDNIIPIGKESKYALAEWDIGFTGSRTAYLAGIIRKEARPMTLAEIMQCYRQQYPDATDNQLTGLLFSRNEDLFIGFDNGMWGLRELHKPSDSLVERVAKPRHKAGIRLSQFKNFVIEHQRFPFYNGDQEEASLCRWRYNVSRGKINLEPDEIIDFENFCRDHSDLPSKVSEVNFSGRCNENRESLIQDEDNAEKD